MGADNNPGCGCMTIIAVVFVFVCTQIGFSIADSEWFMQRFKKCEWLEAQYENETSSLVSSKISARVHEATKKLYLSSGSAVFEINSLKSASFTSVLMTLSARSNIPGFDIGSIRFEDEVGRIRCAYDDAELEQAAAKVRIEESLAELERIEGVAIASGCACCPRGRGSAFADNLVNNVLSTISKGKAEIAAHGMSGSRFGQNAPEDYDYVPQYVE